MLLICFCYYEKDTGNGILDFMNSGRRTTALSLNGSSDAVVKKGSLNGSSGAVVKRGLGIYPCELPGKGESEGVPAERFRGEALARKGQ